MRVLSVLVIESVSKTCLNVLWVDTCVFFYEITPALRQHVPQPSRQTHRIVHVPPRLQREANGTVRDFTPISHHTATLSHQSTASAPWKLQQCSNPTTTQTMNQILHIPATLPNKDERCLSLSTDIHCTDQLCIPARHTLLTL